MDGVDSSIAGVDVALPEGRGQLRDSTRISIGLCPTIRIDPRHVVGEIVGIDEYDFGTFFELRDLEAEPVISCLAWSYAIEQFEYEFEAGTEAVVEVSVDFYPDRGDCQLLVSRY